MIILSLTLAAGLLALTTLLLTRLGEGLAVPLPAPLHCEDCFDASERLLYTATDTGATGDPARSRLRRQCALLAAALRTAGADDPALLPRRSTLLRDASDPDASHQHLQQLVRSTVHALQRTSPAHDRTRGDLL